jgi:hypothetical protein
MLSCGKSSIERYRTRCLMVYDGVNQLASLINCSNLRISLTNSTTGQDLTTGLDYWKAMFVEERRRCHRSLDAAARDLLKAKTEIRIG